MKASELRIGNLIQWVSSGNIEIIKDIVTSLDKRECNVNNVSISDCTPIPITEEWLLKFGIKKAEWNQFVFELFADSPNSHFETAKVGDVWQFNKRRGMDDMPINLCKYKYVHQLQNLYFALTGEELTIKKIRIKAECEADNATITFSTSDCNKTNGCCH